MNTRVLVVADAAVANVDEVPSRIREVIDAAGHVYVVTPTLPSRLDWVASEINESRHAADERLDSTLGELRSTGADVTGVTGDDSAMTAIADAVRAFHPDQIVIALRDSEHRNWQERGLIEHVRTRFDMPLLTFAVASHECA